MCTKKRVAILVVLLVAALCGCRFLEVLGGGMETAGDVVKQFPHPAAGFIGLAVSGAGFVIRSVAKRWNDSHRAALVAKAGTVVMGLGGLGFAGENADLIRAEIGLTPMSEMRPVESEPIPITATAR